MSVQLQKELPPFERFLVNLFRTGPQVETIKQNRITVSDLAALPRHTQLLVAYCLEQNDPDLTLLNGDSEVERLVSAGWMNSVPSATVGIRSFKFKPSVWQQLRSLQGQFLTNGLAADLGAYKQTKSVCYPWNW